MVFHLGMNFWKKMLKQLVFVTFGSDWTINLVINLNILTMGTEDCLPYPRVTTIKIYQRIYLFLPLFQGRILKDNVVGATIIISLIFWVPCSCIVHHFVSLLCKYNYHSVRTHTLVRHSSLSLCTLMKRKNSYLLTKCLYLVLTQLLLLQITCS